MSTSQASIQKTVPLPNPNEPTIVPALAQSPATPGRYGNGDAYDRYMGRWSTILARRFLDFVEIGAAERILDIGSGTGSLTRVIAESTTASGIIGIEPVQQFVRSARRRTSDPRVRFDHGAVEELPYPDAEFDASLAQLTFHHFPDGEAALSEMLRVTRPGGLVAACEWDAGPGMEMFRILADTLVAVHPPSGAQHSLRQYAGPGELLDLWTACRIKDVEEESITVPLTFADFSDFWIPFTEGPSGVVNRLNALSPTVKADFQRRLKHRLLNGKSDGPITLHARAWAVRGWAP